MTIQPRPRVDPLPPPPPGITWQQVAYQALIVIMLLGNALFAYLASRTSAQNHEKITSVQEQVGKAREVQAYHETQLDSIGSRIEKVDKQVKKNSSPVYVKDGE